jgi:hypothetical protein
MWADGFQNPHLRKCKTLATSIKYSEQLIVAFIGVEIDFLFVISYTSIYVAVFGWTQKSLMTETVL